MESIPFTDDHEYKIRKRKKRTTMRTVKKDNLYKIGETYKVGDSDTVVGIMDRQVIVYGEDTLKTFDDFDQLVIKGREITGREKLAELEGFEDEEAMLNWFKGRRYKLPQPFFIYWLKLVKNHG